MGWHKCHPWLSRQIDSNFSISQMRSYCCLVVMALNLVDAFTALGLLSVLQHSQNGQMQQLQATCCHFNFLTTLIVVYDLQAPSQDQWPSFVSYHFLQVKSWFSFSPACWTTVQGCTMYCESVYTNWLREEDWDNGEWNAWSWAEPPCCHFLQLKFSCNVQYQVRELVITPCGGKTIVGHCEECP